VRMYVIRTNSGYQLLWNTRAEVEGYDV
jgi:hypothetical protein